MPGQADPHTWGAREVTDVNGEAIGHAEAIYIDERTGEPAFLLVRGGIFGNQMHFAPVEGATLESEAIRLAYDADTVKDAPNVSADEHLSMSEERRLFDHYGLSNAPDGSSAVIILSSWVLVE
ncbi:MAG: hypothetical protein QOE17_809 [Gaiellales bacterium]|nr:hypothetical protein [Gaiellales bacterium]